MRFSLIITTRHRPTFVFNILDSINNTTTNKKEVEIHITYDTDDTITAGIIDEIKQKYPELNTLFHPTERSEWMVRDYVNWTITNFSTGKYIINLNDDVLFLNKGWDELGWAKLEDYLRDKPDGVVYGNTEDNELAKAKDAAFIAGAFACFPVISRVAVDAAGGFHAPEFKSWSSDIASYLIFRALDRILDLRNEIILYHFSTHSGRREKDEVFLEMERKNQGGYTADTFVERDVKRILNYINSFK